MLREISIGLIKGLAPIWRQAISQTNVHILYAWMSSV